MTPIRLFLIACLSAVLAVVPSAQEAFVFDPIAIAPDAGLEGAIDVSLPDTPIGEESERGMRFSAAIEIALLLTALSVLPALLISLTCFTRIVIVLSFVRRSMAVNELPPNPIVIGLAMFLTTFVMAPVFERVYSDSYLPYSEGVLPLEEAVSGGWGELRGFLLSNTRESELLLFAEMADVETGTNGEYDVEALPFQVVIPAFVLSELKTAFQMGFLLFLPFLVIDLIVASILISMGMFMLPPVMISTPFKILLFVLVDGWHLVCESLVTSFVIT